jgi:uncharacterized membrane protein
MISNDIGFGIVDGIVGGLSTLIFVTLGVVLFKKYLRTSLKNQICPSRPFFRFFSLSMVPIAAELKCLFAAPFWLTWATRGLGELISLLIGALIICQISKRLDLTK